MNRECEHCLLQVVAGTKVTETCNYDGPHKFVAIPQGKYMYNCCHIVIVTAMFLYTSTLTHVGFRLLGLSLSYCPLIHFLVQLSCHFPFNMFSIRIYLLFLLFISSYFPMISPCLCSSFLSTCICSIFNYYHRL